MVDVAVGTEDHTSNHLVLMQHLFLLASCIVCILNVFENVELIWVSGWLSMLFFSYLVVFEQTVP